MEEDLILYKKFLDGNIKSFEELVKKYEKNLKYFITRYVKKEDIVQDVYQETILYVIEKKEYYNFKYSFKTYLYMIAKSKALDYLKKEKNHDDVDDVEIKSEEILEEIVLSNVRKEKIIKVIKKLPQDYQIVIYLTIIDGNSYLETANIMEKTEKQIKTLLYNARKKLRKLLVDEKIIEIKNNHIVRLLTLILCVFVLTGGFVYAGIKYFAIFNSSFTSKIKKESINTIWVGSFQLAWNELENQLGYDIKFDDYNEECEELNNNSFTKDMISDESYYINMGKNSDLLFKNIEKDCKDKFNINVNLKNENGSNNINSYTIYAVLNKSFEFENKFDKLNPEKFNDSTENIEYFGINNKSDEILNENVEVLFFEYGTEDYAVKLNTKENEEIILYKTNKIDSFANIYRDIELKNQIFEGNKNFTSHDQIYIPYISINETINYDEICNKKIKGSNGEFIASALQNVKFELNERGGNLLSESKIKKVTMAAYSDSRIFKYNDTFYLFMKEKNSEKPYFALKVDSADILKSK